MAPLKPWKTRITKTAKSLEDLITRSNPFTSFTIPNLNSEDEITDILKGKQATIATHITNITKLLESLRQAQTSMEESFKALGAQQQLAEESSFEECADAAFTTISNAEETLVKLSEKQTEINTRLERTSELEERRRNTLTENSLQTPGQRTPASYASSLQAQGLLPRLQIPTFSGNKREWDSFWAIFKANIEDQPIPVMLKFNYLLQSLTGEPRQVANRYQISEDNYSIVVDALKHKYGRDNSIIEELFKQLESLTATGPSTTQQISLLDKISAIMSQLAAKGQDTDHRMLLNTVLRKFESNIQLKALEKREQLETPSYWTWQTLRSDLLSILELRERVEQSQKVISDYKESNISRSQQPCIYCRRTNHSSKNCRTVPHTQRVAFLTRNQMCLNCAKTNHRTAECRSRGCFRCGRKHHSSTSCPETPTERTAPLRSSLPPQLERANTNAPARAVPKRGQRQDTLTRSTQNVITIDNNNIETQNEQIEEETQINQVNGSGKHRRGSVVLLTGTATIEGPQGLKKVRILLDTGSQLSFIDSTLVDELKLPVIDSTTLKIRTFGSQTPTQKEHRIVKVNLITRDGSSRSYEFFDNDTITNNSNKTQLTKRDWEYVKDHGIDLSPNPEDQEKPRILVGCDHLWEMVDCKQCKLPSGLHLITTIFGPMISGKQSHNTQSIREAATQNIVAQEERDAWDRYWAIESSGTNEFTGPEKKEKQALNEKIIKTFKETIIKKPEGYYVRLPWKENHADLPDNKAMAVARLRNLLRQYSVKELNDIDDIFKQQLQQGVIEQVPQEAIRKCQKKIHYLPYQVINRPEKQTTPKRVVFDASAHSRGKLSLNDVLYQGPLIMPTIIGMLLRFTVGKIAFTADIEKAFLQVHLHEIDRDATRFLWVCDIKQPAHEHNLVTYRFTRVTFGLNSSPFLLAATIHFHLDSCSPESKIAAEIKENLYVDNLIMTAETKEEAVIQYQNSKDIFKSMNMNMREYVSNDETLMATFKSEDKTSNSTVKVLGVEWRADSDEIVTKCSMEPLNTITKRTVLHGNASIYDPLGWLTPLMIRNKLFFQSLWKKSYDWDDPLQQQDQDQWKKLFNTITGFHKKHSRKLMSKNTTHELIAFSDASSTAMAACVYVKQKDQCRLLIAKSKLPSLQSVHTVPKLELNALTVAARLALSSFRELEKVTTTKAVYLLSDSEIALNWLKSATNTTKSLGVLVTNRIQEIRSIVEEFNKHGITVYCAYVPTTLNPADCATRGLTAQELLDHIWWEGPSFIREKPEDWPAESQRCELLSHDNDVLHTFEEQSTSFPWERFSSMKKLERTTVCMLRFIWKTINKLPLDTQKRIKDKIALYGIINQTNITASEMRNAHHALILMHQTQYGNVLQSNTQNKLNIKQDSKGIWRCWGRLGKSHLPEDAKNPIFIAPNTDLAKLIILQAHGILHRSTAHTMAEVRSKYWIPRLRQQVRHLLRTCIPCQRYNNLPLRYPPLADIPERRVIRSRPFEHVGFDLFGPLKTKHSANSNDKAYGAIFTCATTRLVHLELLCDASTISVINAIRRFIARRGIPSTITCDNAPTFTLAEQILKEGTEKEIQSFLSCSHIEWHRITPYAPWKGGFYERLIKDIKRSLYKSLGRKTVPVDSLSTILIEIEGCLNSRPLTYQESDLEDITPIRPIDFLQNHLTLTCNWNIDNTGDEQYHPPGELAHIQTKVDAEKALTSSCELVEKFWDSWSELYLKSLREHQTRLLKQGRTTNTTPQAGQVVLLQDPFQPRNNWKLAKILKLLPSQDEQTRSVELLLPNRHSITRPITALVPLELGGECTERASEIAPALHNTLTHRNTHVAAPPQTPAKQGLRARTTNKNYPYNEDEYEINVIDSSQSINPISRMQAPAESKMITMEAIAKFMQNTVQKLEQLATQQEKNTELILVQIQKALNLTSTDRNGNVTVEPDAVTRARKRLQELEHVKTRTFAKKRTLLMRHDDNKPKCGFCRSVGMHDSDGCYKYTTAKSRKEVLANAALCENCLRLCPKPCKANTMCDYCGATNHNTAICEAPEEKRRCLQTVREWELLGKPPCIEEVSSADISDVFTGPQCADALSWAEESSIKSVV